ncbi:MAG: DUF354 domain-containing protein [Actinobacteria bacterium]|nr:MAG: DUF354 domain-containing protein [Actinomycetota bacterium]
MPHVWIDMTNSPHVLVLRPVIDEFRRRGWRVSVTSREFAQTLPLLDRFGIEHTVLGRHRGGNMLAKAWGLIARSSAMLRWGMKHGPFDLAVSHASNDLPVVSWLMGVPHVTMFDYEHAWLTHSINVRLSAKALIPDVIPPSAIDRYGGRGKVDGYPGIKEDYYLADFEPDPTVPGRLGLDGEKIIVVVRTPPSQAAYHRVENPLFDDVLRAIAAREDVQAVVMLRTPDQRQGVEAVGASNIIVPAETIDAQSLICFADLVIGAGGSVNREAASLGTPVVSISPLEKGAVDASLVADGLMRFITSADELEFRKKPPGVRRVRRQVSDLVDRMAAVAK